MRLTRLIHSETLKSNTFLIGLISEGHSRRKCTNGDMESISIKLLSPNLYSFFNVGVMDVDLSQ